MIVYNKSTLCYPLTFFVTKNGMRIPLGKILNPNNGLNFYSQFFKAVHVAYDYNLQVEGVVNKVVLILQAKISELDDTKMTKKWKFITQQLQLLTEKTFSVVDYCFAIESFSKCDYEQLRDLLVLPSKQKLQSVVTSVNIDLVLKKTFQKVENQQKNAFLIVDEVKIHPTVAFSVGILNGEAKNYCGGALAIHTLNYIYIKLIIIFIY